MDPGTQSPKVKRVQGDGGWGFRLMVGDGFVLMERVSWRTLLPSRGREGLGEGDGRVGLGPIRG
jgi:hypothetical protein